MLLPHVRDVQVLASRTERMPEALAAFLGRRTPRFTAADFTP